ncbi:MAG: hypothetical protein WCH78_14035 [Bacteroidota bacterium]
MKKLNSFLSVLSMLVFTVLICSCWSGQAIYDPYYVPQSRQEENLYYIPTTTNLLALSEKNEIGANILNTASDKYSGTEIQTSFIPDTHLGIMGSLSSARSSSLKFNSYELGVGYLKKYKNWNFENYVGWGNGKILNTHQTGTSTININHFFIQPGFILNNSKRTVQFGIVSKFNAVHFNIDTTFNNDREAFSTQQAKSLYENQFHLIWEPAAILRFGWKKFLFHSSYTVSNDFTNPNLHKANSVFMIGVSLRLNLSKNENLNQK